LKIPREAHKDAPILMGGSIFDRIESPFDEEKIRWGGGKRLSHARCDKLDNKEKKVREQPVG